MKVNDRSRPQGSINVTNKSMSSSGWDALGAKDPELPEGDYKLQVGDLDNRSSLQFIGPKGHTLTQFDRLLIQFNSSLIDKRPDVIRRIQKGFPILNCLYALVSFSFT